MASESVYVCPHCGYISWYYNGIFKRIHECRYCASKMEMVPDYTVDSIIRDIKYKNHNAILEKYVYNSGSFCAEAMEQRKEQEHQRSIAMTAEREAVKARQAAEQATAPRCPTCNSTDIKKIGGVDRAFSVAFWGLASSKIGKTFKCNHCGYTW